MGSQILQFSLTEGMIEKKDFLKELSSLKKYLPMQKNRRSELYYNIPSAYDIETTSFYLNDSGQPEDKRAIMYHWQYGVWNLVTYGRTWEEYLAFLDALRYTLNLSEHLKLITYIHNMPYEFQWMRKRMEWDKVFLLDERKPVYAVSDGIEFRDMLKLAGGRSLANVAKDLTKYQVEKMVGDLDYSVIRTPKTQLTGKEKKYCENDIRVCLSYIQEKIEHDKGVMNIPLTNTGYVRVFCRSRCFERRNKYRRIIEKLTVTPDEYDQLKRGFQGGFTHADARYVKKVLSNVGSFDLASAYPAAMLLMKFPMSSAMVVNKKITKAELKRLLYNYCCLFDLRVTHVVPKLTQDHPISKSKCRNDKGEKLKEGCTTDNGRIVTADVLNITATEQDFFTYQKFYDWDDDWQISNFRYYEKEYLPKALAEAILKLYGDKTQLKGVADMVVEYMISKNMINAAYGMIVTDIIRDILEYFFDYERPRKPNIKEAIEKYNNDLKRFLFYPWGVWVTAYCRATLFSAIEACGTDYVYADTDSVKIRHPERHMDYFNKYNEWIMERIQEAAEARRHDIALYSPVDRKGKPHPIGVWENEGTYDKFKTLGAKRYLVQKGADPITDKELTMLEKDGYISRPDSWVADSSGRNYRLTVAGTNKQKSGGYLLKTGDPFGAFDDKLVIPPESTGKLLLKYIDNETSGWIVDKDGEPYFYDELSSIHMENAPYSLSLSSDFRKFLEGVVDIGE